MWRVMGRLAMALEHRRRENYSREGGWRDASFFKIKAETMKLNIRDYCGSSWA